MSSTRQKTAGGISDDLTSEQRIEITQRNLAREVSAACDSWLRARGIGPQTFNRDGHGKARHDRSQAQEPGSHGHDLTADSLAPAESNTNRKGP